MWPDAAAPTPSGAGSPRIPRTAGAIRGSRPARASRPTMPLPSPPRRAAVGDVGGRVVADPGMAVRLVVPAEEAAAEGAGVLDRADPGREVRAVLERLELRLGVGVVVRAARARVALGDAQVGEQERH